MSRSYVLDHTALFAALQDSEFRNLVSSQVSEREARETIEAGRQVAMKAVPVSCQSGCTLRSVMQPIATALGQAWSSQEDLGLVRSYFENRLSYRPEAVVLYYQDRGTTLHLSF